MKSDFEARRKRGYLTLEEAAAFAPASTEEWINLLNAPDACTRTAAAKHLPAKDPACARALLQRLQIEKCLYTRLAICESLQQGDVQAARLTADRLGTIGNNQYRQPPARPSAKRSYPLPRDIAARVMGKMEPSVFPVLANILQSGDEVKLSEALDAAGFMAFYHPVLRTCENAGLVVRLARQYQKQPLLLWKAALCLSAFPSEGSRRELLCLRQRDDVIGAEAARSLSFFS